MKEYKIRPAIINTFNRVGIDYKPLAEKVEEVEVFNRFGAGNCITTPLIAFLIEWVYSTSNDYERGIQNVNISDFDRIRYYILEVDHNAYMTCID